MCKNKIRELFILILAVSGLASCNKEDGIWNLKRQSKFDLMNDNVIIDDLYYLDFSILNISSDGFEFSLNQSIVNNTLQVVESGVCFNKTGMPDISQNKESDAQMRVTGLETNTKYFIRAYAILNNTALENDDQKKYTTIYSDEESITTNYEMCFDFTSATSLNNSGWSLSNFWVTSSPSDNGISNDLLTTGTSNISQSFYNLPFGTSFNFNYGDYWGANLYSNQNITVRINNSLVATLTSSGFVSIPLPEGNVSITITVNDNNSNASVVLRDFCIQQ
jgi:hypothetical protein